MDISGIGSSMGAVQNRFGANASLDGIGGSDITQNVHKAVEDMQQDKDLEQFQIFVHSGQTPDAQRYQEDWMRPVENFML